MDNIYIATFTAFSGGLFSFFSPCVVPVLTTYISYLAGTSINGKLSVTTDEEKQSTKITKNPNKKKNNKKKDNIEINDDSQNLNDKDELIENLNISDTVTDEELKSSIKALEDKLKAYEEKPTVTNKPNKTNLFLNMVFFTLGISTTFFMLTGAVRLFFTSLIDFDIEFRIICALLILQFSLFQLGVIEVNKFNKTKFIDYDFTKKKVSFLVSYIMGFTYSFTWSPCVGPTLASITLLAGSADSNFQSIVMTLSYTLGFIIPFLIIGIFTEKTIALIEKNKKSLLKIKKLNGLVLLCISLGLFQSLVDDIKKYNYNPSPVSDYMSSNNTLVSTDEGCDEDVCLEDTISDSSVEETVQSLNSLLDEEVIVDTGVTEIVDENDSDVTSDVELLPLIKSLNIETGKIEYNEPSGKSFDKDLVLTNNYNADKSYGIYSYLDYDFYDNKGGKTNLADLEGKTIVLAYFGTWCSACGSYLPTYEEVYQAYADNDDVVIMAVSLPSTPYTSNMTNDGDVFAVMDYIDGKGYNFPVLLDADFLSSTFFGITAFPTTAIISPDAQVLEYVQGALSYDNLVDAIDNALGFYEND